MNDDHPIKIASIKSGMSINEICKGLGITSAEINEWDKNNISFSQLESIADYTGVSLDALRGNVGSNSPVFEEIYNDENKSLINLIEENRNKVHLFRDRIKLKKDDDLSAIVDEIIKRYDDFADITLRNVRKPVVCAFGKSDTGKSTLINYLFNEKVARADYNPVTSAIVYYHHTDEMPEYLRKKECNAFVFGLKNGRRKRGSFSHDDIFDPKAAKYLIAYDSFDIIMDRFSTRDGDNYRNKDYRVFEIDVFLDNKVLHEMTFIDTPGFESDDKKDDIGLKLANKDIDVVFYLSIADGFMRPDDFLHLRNRLISRNSAEGVFVLATHAQSIKEGPSKLTDILDGGCKRFFDNCTEQFREENGLSKYDELRKHFYAFDTGNKRYCSELNKAFSVFISDTIRNKSKNAKEQIAAECSRLNSYYLERKSKISVSTDFQKKSKESEEKFLNERKSELKYYRAELKRHIGEYKAESIREFDLKYENIMQKHQLVELMNKRKTKNNKNEIQTFADYLSQLIADEFNRIVSEKSELFTEEVNRAIDKYKESWTNDVAFDVLKTRFDWFDFKAVFASGLTGTGMMGALTVWAGITAAGSNLGAYILVAKIASALSISSVSAVQFVSALGGPIVFAATLAITSALAMFGIFSSNWKSRTAGEIIKHFKKNKTREHYVEHIEKYWNSTIEQLDSCLDSLESNLLKFYREENRINIRTLEEEDRELQRELNYFYGRISDIYWDIAFSIETFDERKKSDIFHERKKAIQSDLELMLQHKHRYRLISKADDFENLIFLEQDELTLFWNILDDLLSGNLDTVVLSKGMQIYKYEKKFTIYFVLNNEEISVRYIDVFLHKSQKYVHFRNLVTNTYPIKDDQIRYKVFDMFRSAQKEILIMMPWLNDFGWNKEGNYGSSVKKEIEAALKKNSELKIKIFVGYDLDHPDADKEEKTRKKAQEIRTELKKYGDRLEIFTDVGTHEKKITVDDICALSGSFNLLSNEAPYQKKRWASDSMDIIENYKNIERQRREILERANKTYKLLDEM